MCATFYSGLNVEYSGESASSAGTESLADPLEKMALDVGMLDRQYRKITDRQRQAHIVVGGMYIHVKNIDFQIKKKQKTCFFTFIKKHLKTCIKTLKLQG